MVKPHGGRLTNRVLSISQSERLKKEIDEFIHVPINSETYLEIENIAIGTYSPLEGYMTQQEFESVLETNRLTNDLAWTIPITFDISKNQTNGLEKGNQILLTYQNL